MTPQKPSSLSSFTAARSKVSLSLPSSSHPKRNNPKVEWARTSSSKAVNSNLRVFPLYFRPYQYREHLEVGCIPHTGLFSPLEMGDHVDRGLAQARVGRARAPKPLCICSSLEGRSVRGALVSKALKSQTAVDPVMGGYHPERKQDSKSLGSNSFVFLSNVCQVSHTVLNIPTFKHFCLSIRSCVLTIRCSKSVIIILRSITRQVLRRRKSQRKQYLFHEETKAPSCGFFFSFCPV